MITKSKNETSHADKKWTMRMLEKELLTTQKEIILEERGRNRYRLEESVGAGAGIVVASVFCLSGMFFSSRLFDNPTACSWANTAICAFSIASLPVLMEFGKSSIFSNTIRTSSELNMKYRIRGHGILRGVIEYADANGNERLLKYARKLAERLES